VSFGCVILAFAYGLRLGKDLGYLKGYELGFGNGRCLGYEEGLNQGQLGPTILSRG